MIPPDDNESQASISNLLMLKLKYSTITWLTIAGDAQAFKYLGNLTIILVLRNDRKWQ